MRLIADFFVAGLPKAQPRTKARRIGNRAGVYTPSTANQWKATVAYECRAAMPRRNGRAETNAVDLCLRFYMERPKSHFGSGRNRHKIRDSAPAYPTPKPDWDNLAKAVCDALTGIAWKDDALICHADVWLVYADHGETPGVKVTIGELVHDC